MALQRSHGRLYPLVANVDELPEAQAAAEAAPCGPVERDASGRVTSPEAARALGRRGGIARARKRAAIASAGSRLKLTRYLEADEVPPNKRLLPHIDEAERWLNHTCRELAQSTGGGRLSPMTVSVLTSAAWARAFSAYFYDCASRSAWSWDTDEGAKPSVRPHTELALVASRLATESRMHCIAGFELAAREAAARPPASFDPLAAFMPKVDS